MVPNGGTHHLPPPLAPSADATMKEDLCPRQPGADFGPVESKPQRAERVGEMSATKGPDLSESAAPAPAARAYGEVSSARNVLGSERAASYSTPPAPKERKSPPGSAPSEEAAALLLNFSAVHEPLPPPALKEEAPYPHTPPLDSPSTLARAHAPSSLAPSSPTGLPTPSAPSPEASTSTTTTTKTKRKRKSSSHNAVAGPSRYSSTDPGTAPAHWMGEDNSRIRCICGIEEDDGFTVQCEGCYAWQHAKCFGYPNGQNLPDVYYCEKCEPRPFDAEAARDLQIRTRARIVPQGEPAEPKRPRPKTKRPRVESGSGKPEAAGEATEDSRDPMAPPAKPKRKSQLSGKPRSKTSESGVGGGGMRDEDDYFRAQPWELEYTPLKDNLVRGVPARRAIAALLREWVDGEEEINKSRPSYHDSGLPSPTETGVLRLSPDPALSPPDFSILAAPIPPVFLSGPDLESLAAQTYLRPVEDPVSASCYLPLKYIEPSQNIYARPTIYGVFTSEALSMGAFLGEYRCEILDTATYRKDPINQYAALGIPKPYVHSVGPPVNLMLDARSYGNEMRFVRSGCHPNAVIRPIFFRSAESHSHHKLHFGIFAAKELSKNEEVVLGWEWDDQHVVHTLRSIIDSTLTKAANKTPVIIAPETVELLTTKFDTILTNIFSTFQSCACTVNTDCAFAQMRRQVSGQAFHGVSGARARKRIDLGELIGAVRGWRKREIEEQEATGNATRFRNSGEWELWRAGPSPKVEAESRRESRPSSERQPSQPAEDQAPPPPAVEQHREGEKADATDDETMEVDEQTPKPVASTVTQVEKQVQVPPEPPVEESDVEETAELRAPADDTMDVDEAAPKPEDEATNYELRQDDIKTTTTSPAVPPPPAEESKEEVNGGDVEMAEAPRTPVGNEQEAPRTPVGNEPASLPAPSSTLSSIPADRLERLEALDSLRNMAEGEEELDESGHVSDATTVTIVRSNFSGSEGEQSEPIKTSGHRIASNRRRVVSPVASKGSEPARKQSVPKGSSTTDRRNSKDPRRRSRKHIIESTDEDASDSEPHTPKVRRSPAKSKARPKSVKRAKVSVASGSDSDDEDDATRPKPRKASTSDRKDRRNTAQAVMKESDHDQENQPKSKNTKQPRDTPKPTKKTRRPSAGEVSPAPRQDAPSNDAHAKDTARKDDLPEASVVAKGSPFQDSPAEEEFVEGKPVDDAVSKQTAQEKATSAGPERNEVSVVKEPTPAPKEATPTPKDATPALKEATPTLKEATLPPAKEATPPPAKEATPPPAKEATPPPAKEPTPPPPPKKVSLKDYLASHKIRKKEKTPEPEAEEAKIAKAEPKEDKVAEAAPSTPATSAVPAPAAPAQPARLNFLEHLPSSRSTNSTPLGTPFTPGGANAAAEPPRLSASSAFVPRSDAQRVSGSGSDYFNAQTSGSGSGSSTSTPSSFAPRPSPNFVPRALDDPPRDSLHPSPVSAFQPRQSDHEYQQLSPVAPRAALPLQTPPSKFQPLPDIPPALGVRDGPPHHGHRVPPTGPRHAPTGPRGAWGAGNPGPGTGANASGGPVSPVNSMRGGFGGRSYAPRGGFDRGYGFRGRGGPPRGRGGRM